MPKCNFNKVALHEWFPVNLLHIFRTPFPKDTSGRLLLKNKPSKSNQKSCFNLGVASGFLNQCSQIPEIPSRKGQYFRLKNSS